MAAAVLSSPHLPLGPTLGQEAAAANHQQEWKSPDDYRRELMIEYAYAEYGYVITEDEADEIFDHPDWWEDVDAFVEYMQEVNSFGSRSADVALPSTLRVYTDAELDAMEETGDFYPPSPPSLSSDDDSDESLYEEDEEEPLPLYEPRQLPAYGESLPAKAPPTYMESVDAIFAALGQELEMLGLVHHVDDHAEEQRPQQPEVVLEEEEPEDEQLDTLSRWLGSLTVVPTTPRVSIEVAAEEEVAAMMIDTSLLPPSPSPPPSPMVLETHEAVQVTMAVATPALVVLSRPETSAPPPPATRRERFSRRVRKVKSTLSRGLKAISCSSSSSCCSS
ncbi:hypothetical protein PG985_011577 [Apiospora marii]|uniref:Uncharacterized protein n=1 Tax=Apiospora marii TaxID=335849 RepID=A0ABR1R0N0_9PEZI